MSTNGSAGMFGHGRSITSFGSHFCWKITFIAITVLLMKLSDAFCCPVCSFLVMVAVILSGSVTGLAGAVLLVRLMLAQLCALCVSAWMWLGDALPKDAEFLTSNVS